MGGIRSVVVLLAVACLSCGAALRAEDQGVDPGLPEYQVTSGISGKISSVGSDTLNNCMAAWAEEFRKLYPAVTIEIEGKGSATAPPALIAGTSQLGPMSRAMKPTEMDEFEKKYGYKPTAIRVAVDALAVFVNKDNPIKGLNFAQVDAIFSKTHKRMFNAQFGEGQDIKTWGQLGLKGEWADRPISIFGRNSASGTYGYFKEHVLSKGDYKDTVKEQPGSAAVVQGVTSDPYAIGYSGIGYATAGVRALPLTEKGDTYVEATKANAYSGSYPLSRYLYIYINHNPNKGSDPLVAEFLKYVLSKQGQVITVKDGYFPLLPAQVTEDAKKL